MKATDVELETLPCGCRMGTAVIDGEPTFVYRPCRDDCEYYRYVIELTAQRRMPLTIKTVVRGG